jgi:hypothetical protein
MAEARPPVGRHPKPFAVRSAMGKRTRHAREKVAIDRACRPIGVRPEPENSRDSAHRAFLYGFSGRGNGQQEPPEKQVA